MEWADLREGDILEYNLQFLKAFEAKFGLPVDSKYSSLAGHLDKFHVVDKVVPKEGRDQMDIHFKDVGQGRPPTIPIQVTGEWFELPEGPPAFNIVSLVEEK